MTSPQQYAQIGLNHLGEPGPNNTCLSNGVQKWAGEAGLPQLGNNTATVSVYRAAAKQLGYYHSGSAGISVGDVLDWAFINGIIGHVSVCTAVDNAGVHSVASGTSKGVISLSTIPHAAIQGYVRLPFNGESSMTINPSAQVTAPPAGTTSGASGLFPSLITVAENVAQPGFWMRFGIIALGVALLGIAAIRILAATSAGQQAISTTKSAIKDAAAVAVV